MAKKEEESKDEKGLPPLTDEERVAPHHQLIVMWLNEQNLVMLFQMVTLSLQKWDKIMYV